ncbi:MAG: G/U mismatch-specific DNA glycosylase [Gammaproteobacteria bacterium]|nr:MAG: G/U mismatch-specific DNA glycosylase [Gammaproteobacteria bacterium]
MKTLPDFLQPGMRILSIGLNPSLPSVEAGFYFANPRNRFWKVLNASDLISEPVEPGRAAMQLLLQREGMGFTDLVKRPTRGAADLRASDYREAAPRLHRLIEKYQPQCAWFHGKLAYGHFVRYGCVAVTDVDWGLQAQGIGRSRIFVTPNPSPANAAFSVHDLVTAYRRLAACLAEG